MNDHDDMTNDDVMSADELAEDDRRVEYALDAADEERHQQIRDGDEAFESGHASKEEPW